MEQQQPQIWVMKFGGASVKDADSVRNVGGIIQSHFQQGNGLILVISAIDKTTNELEKLAWLARDQREQETFDQLMRIRNFHMNMAEELVPEDNEDFLGYLTGLFQDLEKILRGVLMLGDFPSRTYDRIVAFGELLSTHIVVNYLQRNIIRCCWADVRDFIRTDGQTPGANVIWSVTRDLITNRFTMLFRNFSVIVTQGFIASTLEGKTTTLGREGSDYTAAIFANCVDASRLIVWKDVAGVLSGDPRIEEQTEKIDQMSYEEAVEMTFYGATVLHPKTIKPLYEKGIMLEVKCFKDPEAPGTQIQIGPHSYELMEEPICSRIVRKGQALLSLTPRDFSFMDERQLSRVFNEVSRAGLTLRLVQTSAISLTLCVDHHHDAIERFESHVIDRFELRIEDGLILRTLVNFSKDDLAEGENALLLQTEGNKLHIIKYDPDIPRKQETIEFWDGPEVYDPEKHGPATEA